MSIVDHTTSVEYRDIPWVPNYRFGSDGSVWSNYAWGCRGATSTKWRKLKLSLNRRYNRLYAGLHVDGKRRAYAVSRLILEAFVGPCPPGMVACHYPDPTPTNCRLNNLRWDTPKANAADAIRQGRNRRGSTHHNAKLTEDTIVKVRALHSVGWPQKAIAAMFGVSPSTMSFALAGKTWYHVAADGSTIIEDPPVIAPEFDPADKDDPAFCPCTACEVEFSRLKAEVARLTELLAVHEIPPADVLGAIRSGQTSARSRNCNSKLTEADIPEIRSLRADGWTQKAIGDRFGVTQAMISLILAGKWWCRA